MEPSFATLNTEWGTRGNPGPQTLTAMRDADAMTGFGGVHVSHRQTVRYTDYPGGAPFPLMWFGFLVGSVAWNVYSQGKDHWGTSPMPRGYLWVFDASLAFGLVFMVFDTIVTVNGTHEHYGTTKGIEANGYLRQWGAWVREKAGINFAWAMVLTDVIEAAILVSSWYFARKERNVTGLLALWSLGGSHCFAGWWTWKASIAQTLAMIPGILAQLSGGSHKYQGGGPQTVIGVV